MLFGTPLTRRIILGTGLVLLLYLVFGVNYRVLAVRINQLNIEVERRVQWDYWPDTNEEKWCREPHDLVAGQNPIPNVAHFIMLRPEGETVDLTFPKYLALKAAVMRMGAAKIILHTWDGVVKDSEYWDVLKKHVTLVNLDAYRNVTGPHGLELKDLQFAHQADVLRLAILQREGGIYFDTDMYILKPFTDLLTSPRGTVLGHEGGNRFGLCNAVVVTRPNAPFLDKWQAEYEASFNPNQWNDHSVLVPKRLQVQYPDLICPLSPTVFFWPTWAVVHVNYMYDPINSTEAAEFTGRMKAYGGGMYENQLAFHAWGGHDQLKNLTVQEIRTEDTRFNLLMREIASAAL